MEIMLQLRSVDNADLKERSESLNLDNDSGQGYVINSSGYQFKSFKDFLEMSDS